MLFTGFSVVQIFRSKRSAMDQKRTRSLAHDKRTRSQSALFPRWTRQSQASSGKPIETKQSTPELSRRSRYPQGSAIDHSLAVRILQMGRCFPARNQPQNLDGKEVFVRLCARQHRLQFGHEIVSPADCVPKFQNSQLVHRLCGSWIACAVSILAKEDSPTTSKRLQAFELPVGCNQAEDFANQAES